MPEVRCVMQLPFLRLTRWLVICVLTPVPDARAITPLAGCGAARMGSLDCCELHPSGPTHWHQLPVYDSKTMR